MDNKYFSELQNARALREKTDAWVEFTYKDKTYNVKQKYVSALEARLKTMGDKKNEQ